MADEEECTHQLKWDPEGMDEVRRMLDPSSFLETGCRVHKEPGACILCIRNNDCAKIPMHIHCRCVPMPFLSVLERP